MLTVVIGPPAAGKSTWIRQHARPDDIVIDFDLIADALTGPSAPRHDHTPAVWAVTRAARRAAIKAAVGWADQTDVYIIHSTPAEATLARYREQGARIVTVDPGRDVVMERCRRERPPKMMKVAAEWYAQPRATSGDGGGAPAGGRREW